MDVALPFASRLLASCIAQTGWNEIVAAAREASISTHGGALAIAAAAATAAAVSAAIDGASPLEIIEIAQRAAAQAERNGQVQRMPPSRRPCAPSTRICTNGASSTLREVAARYFPDGPLTIVPLALALGTVMDSAEAAILLATNIGGDSDSVASIAGAIARSEMSRDRERRMVCGRREGQRPRSHLHRRGSDSTAMLSGDSWHGSLSGS